MECVHTYTHVHKYVCAQRPVHLHTEMSAHSDAAEEPAMNVPGGALQCGERTVDFGPASSIPELL